MKLVDNVAAFTGPTTIPIPVERVLQSAIEAKPKYVLVVGEGEDGSLYFASSESDGGTALWWMEKAKNALMEISK